MSRKIATEKLVDMANGRMSPEEAVELLKRVEHDPEASMQLDIIAGLSDLAAKEPEFFSGSSEHSSQVPWAERVAEYIKGVFVGRRSALRLGFAGIALTVISLVVVFFPSRGDPYVKLVDIGGMNVPLQVRGTADEDIRQAQESAATGNYQQAIALLERRLRIFPQDEMSDYVHYSLGLFYLGSAERSRLFVRSFDLEEVERAAAHMERALVMTHSVRLQEEIRWFLAQSYLALHAPETARAQLDTLVTQGGFRASDAARQIKALDGLLAGR